MNKNEFIDAMEKTLIRLPKADRDDILSDYEAHFAIGVENGKTEEEVSASLGDPYELAATYLENLPEGSKSAPASQPTESESDAADSPIYDAPTYGAPKAASRPAACTTSRASSESPDNGSVVLVVFLSIAAAFALFTVVSAWLALPCLVFACFVCAAALAAACGALMLQSVLIGVGLLLAAIAAVALGILGIIACIASVKGIIWLVKKFIELCRNLLKGGSK